MSKGHILFADNVKRFLNARAELLEDAGYTVVKASSPQEARQMLEEARVQLAILDIRLVDDTDEEDVSGLTLAKEPAFRPIPKIILTGFPDYEDVRDALGPVVDGLPPAVKYVVKEEGAEVLISAIEEAFAQHVRINNDLVIRWGARGELTPHHLASLMIEKGESEHLDARAGELEDLLRRQFYDYDQILLDRILTRRAQRLLLAIFAHPTEGPERQFVVACGARAQVLQEAERHSSLVPALEGEGATALQGSSEMIHFAAAAYRLGGCDLGETSTLAEFYGRKPTDLVLQAMENLFGRTLQPWHADGYEERAQSIGDLCQAWLGVDSTELAQGQLDQIAEDICRAALATGLKGMGLEPHRLTYRSGSGSSHSYPSPSACLYQASTSLKAPALHGLCHGSLDGQSVLVNEAGQTWVVDFARTGSAPLIKDFVSLEAGIRFGVLRGAGLNERHELEKRLLGMAHLEDAVDSKGLSSEAEKALLAIATIRAQAAAVVGREPEPYLLGVLLQAAKHVMAYSPQIRYVKDEMAVFVHALLCVSMVGHRLLAWKDPGQQLPAQATSALWVDEPNLQVWVEGRPVEMTPQGYRLLKYLYDRANQLCQRADIARDVFDMDFEGLHPAEKKDAERHTINSAIRRLRVDIEPNPSKPKYIVTVRGMGYKLVLGSIPLEGDS
jgi:DNA-binding response OmpR family regulator